MTKPSYEEMSRSDLKAYILEHRNDLEAMRVYFHDPSVQWHVMPPMFDATGQPIEENIRFAEEALRQRIAQDHKQEEDRKKDDRPS